jgi:hypothetical protein
MPEYHVELYLDRDPTLDELNQLYEAGCDSMVFSVRDDVPHVAAVIEAPSFAAAIASMIRDVEQAGVVRVLRVDDDLVSLQQIAERIGRSHERARQLARSGKLPPPAIDRGARMKLWRWRDVAAALGRDDGGGDTIDVTNALLALRRSDVPAPLRWLEADITRVIAQGQRPSRRRQPIA